MRRLLLATCMAAAAPAAGQPFQGTAFMSPDVLTAADPSALSGVAYTGRGERLIFDFRVVEWITVEAYLFEARIAGRVVEFQVNPEFESEEASREQVDVYAAVLGRLPAVLLSRLDNVHVNAGRPDHPDGIRGNPDGIGGPQRVFGGNWFDRSITVHTGWGEEYQRDGFLEEVLFHEGAHVSVDELVKDTPEWRAAQQADGGFVSAYARDNPDREDVAESILPYFAVRFRPERLRPGQRQAIEETIPARLEYFNGQDFDWTPYMPAVPALPAAAVALLAALLVAINLRRR